MSFEEVLQAQKRIIQYIHRTPVVTSSTIDQLTGRKVFFKCENLQKTGSFKARGALNAVFKQKELNPACKGVVTHSSGNAGQAMAWAARTAGLPCSVVVPNNAPVVKMNAIKGYGAELTTCEPTPQAREETCQWVSLEKQQVIIPPFDHLDVIAGQGTMAVELLEEVPDLDGIIVPISGGGMISGIAIATKHIRPATKVFAVEPKGKELEPSLRAEKRLWSNPPRFVDTIADGIRYQQVGHIVFPILCSHIEKDVFTVSDDEMIDAMKLVMQRMKLVIEVSTAAGVAAVLSDRMKNMDASLKKVGVILCGGNTDIDKLPWY